MTADFNWRNPDYVSIFRARMERLRYLREHPELIPALRVFYRDNIAQFISDWGCTVDPRNVEVGRSTNIPFILFPKQEEWIDWVIARWRSQRRGLTEKSRDVGMSWLAVSFSCSMCLFWDGFSVGFGSRKAEYVDKLGDMKALLPKARTFMSNLPIEFRGGWRLERDAPHMQLRFPSTGSVISGEGGDNIGRGDRTSIYFVDESAFLEHPDMVEASLSQTTNCRIDMSSANGRANPFAEMRFSGKIPVFTMGWRDDPRKDDDWYRKQTEELDPVVVASEIDIDYSASVEGIVIPSAWVAAAIDAHLKLKIEPSGRRMLALDVADEGKDANGLCGSHGIVIEHLEEWSGKNSDIYATVERAFGVADVFRYDRIRYDADGLGAGVRGDARVINDKRAAKGIAKIEVEAFRGSEGVFDPEGQVYPEAKDLKGRKNLDYFANRKAQSWWSLRRRFQKTYQAVVEGKPFNPDDLISISSACRLYQKAVTELSQPTHLINPVGKIVIDKAPDGSKSPNLADAIMIQYAMVSRPPMVINPRLLAQV